MASFELVTQNSSSLDFEVGKHQLLELMEKAEKRSFSEDVDFIESLGGKPTLPFLRK